MTKGGFNEGLIVGSGSNDSREYALRKAYGEEARIFAYLSKLSNRDELELCAAIASIFGKTLSFCLRQPQIAVSLVSDFVESTKELGIPVSIRSLIAMGMGHGQEEEQG